MGSASSSGADTAVLHPSRVSDTSRPLATRQSADASAEAAGEVTAMSSTLVSAGRVTGVTLHDVCGYTRHGVPAYSNGTSNTWTNTKHFREGVFMGYQWQCVEFARRWLWMTQRLLLPERNCAYSFSGCTYVYRLKSDPAPVPAQRLRQESAAGAAAASGLDTPASPNEVSAATRLTLLGPQEDKEAWEKVPALFVKQGSLVPPVADSLIVYPMSWGSPWGHIGVITAVDLDRKLVYVADQNRFFHDWKGKPYSAVFRLDVSNGRFYIRDHESECKGWLTFPTVVEGHEVEQQPEKKRRCC